MKKILVLFLVVITGNAFSNNSIIAVVNNSPILISSLQNEWPSASTREEKIEIIDNQIYLKLQQKMDMKRILMNKIKMNKH